MGKRKRDLADKSSTLEVQKSDEFTSTNESTSTLHKKKKKRKHQDKVDEQAAFERIDESDDVQQASKTPKKKCKKSHKKELDMENNEPSDKDKVVTEDVTQTETKKKKKRKRKDKEGDTPESTSQCDDHSLGLEEHHKEKRKKHRHKDKEGETPESTSQCDDHSLGLEEHHKEKKKKHKHKDKTIGVQESTIPTNDDSTEIENQKDREREKSKKHKKKISETNTCETVDPDLEEETLAEKKGHKHKEKKKTKKSKLSPEDDQETPENQETPNCKRKKHKHRKELESVERVVEMPEANLEVVTSKRRKRKHKEKIEDTTANEGCDEVSIVETVDVPNPKKKKKRKHDKRDEELDEENVTTEGTNGNSNMEESSGEEVTPKLEAGLEAENVKDVDEETKEKMKKEWQEKTSQKKLRMQQPKLFLIDNFTNDEDARMSFKPVELKDIQDFIQYSVMGNAASINKVRFCKLLRPGLVSKVIVIILNGVTDKRYQENRECFTHLHGNYDLSGQIVQPSSQQSILHQLLQVAISKTQRLKRAYRARKAGTVPPKPAVSTTNPKPSATAGRTSYLLNDEDKILWRFPEPENPEYTHTKHSDAVSNNSPIVSVDCEMCVTKKGSELTRVSLVDEKCNVIYNSLVKPHNPIIDYVTRYSGVTKELLDPVNVRLEDVQKDIIALLPKDVILVGQSLENDLRALKLYHPHVIDTSNLFSGSYRVALRKLAWKYLGVAIQTSDSGHDSVEDAKIAMKLLQLKIEKGSSLEKYASNGNKKLNSDVIPTESMFHGAQSLNHVSMLIDSHSVVRQFMKDPVGAIPCQNDSEALKKTVQAITHSDFICVQFHNFAKLTQGISLEETVVKETLKQLDQRIKKLHKALPLNSVFLTVMAMDPNSSDNKNSENNNQSNHGRFFAGVKVKY